MKVTTIEESFYDLLDPGGIREPTYSLIWIITLAICAILCGCKDWKEVALFAKAATKQAPIAQNMLKKNDVS